MLAFFQTLEPTVVGIEACGASHHWARTLQALGHVVKIMPAQLVKPYVKRSKHDAADAEALCEAMSRPTMRFVPAKSKMAQAALMLLSVRDLLTRQRTQLSNAIRGHAAEFGLVAARGHDKIEPLLERIGEDESLPDLARELFFQLGGARAAVETRLKRIERALRAHYRADPLSQRLAQIPTDRADRGDDAPAQDAGSQRLPLGARLRRLAGAHPEEPFHRRQAAPGRHHPRRRRSPAQRACRRRDRSDPTGQARARAGLALAQAPGGDKAGEARGGGARQQGRPHRLEADDERRGFCAAAPGAGGVGKAWSGRPRGVRARGRSIARRQGDGAIESILSGGTFRAVHWRLVRR